MVESNAENKWKHAFGMVSLHALFNCLQRKILYRVLFFLSLMSIKKKWYVSGPIKINMNIKNKIEIEIE